MIHPSNSSFPFLPQQTTKGELSRSAARLSIFREVRSCASLPTDHQTCCRHDSIPTTHKEALLITEHTYLRRHGWQIDAMVATTNTRKDPTLSKEMICSPRKEPAGGPVRSKSGSSPTSYKQISSLVIDTRDDGESEKNNGDAHSVTVLARSMSPTSAAFSKLISGNNNKQKLRAVQLVNSKYGAVSPKSRPNLIDKKCNAAENLPNEVKSPCVSPSLFQQSAHKVDILHRSLSNEASECDCDDKREEHGKSSVAISSKLRIDPTSPMLDVLSGRQPETDSTAIRVSNFIDSLHQQRGITTTPGGKDNDTYLPPKSPSMAQFTSNNRYSSILSNARSVIASSPVRTKAAVSQESPQSCIAIARSTSFLHRSASRYNASNSDSSDSSDDSSDTSDSSTSTQKDVGDFIDSLNKKHELKANKDAELLSLLKAKLNKRRSEKAREAMKNRELQSSSVKAQLGVQEKTTCEPQGTGEKKNDSVGAAKYKDYAANHNIKKDVNYYAILSQIQKSVQSGSLPLLTGKIFADARKRGMDLAMVSEMINDEKRKANVFTPAKEVTRASAEREALKHDVTKAWKEKLAAMTSKVDPPAEETDAVQPEQSTSDEDMKSVEEPIGSASPSTEQPVPASSLSEDTAIKSHPKPSSYVPSVGGEASESVSNVSSQIATTPTQDIANNESLASASSETTQTVHHYPELLSEIEARIDIVRSTTSSMEFGKILVDTKKSGLSTTHLLRLYKEERENLTNNAFEAASLVVETECDSDVVNSEQEAEDSKVTCPSKSTSAEIMREKLTKEVQNAIRSSNPSEMLGKILADAKSEGMPTEWLFELYTKERMQVQGQMATVKEQGTNPPVSEANSAESEVSDAVSVVSEQIDAPTNVVAATVQQAAPTTDVVDFFSKFSLQAESIDANVDNSYEKQDLSSSVSEVSGYASEIVELDSEDISRESEVSDILSKSLSLDEVNGTVSTSSEDSEVHFEKRYLEEKAKHPALKHLWKSPLQKERLSRMKLSWGFKCKPINGVAAAAALSKKRRLRGPKRTYLTQSTQERTKEHSGFVYIDFYSLYESTTCYAEDEEIDDEVPWEYRDVRQNFLYEKSVDGRNWFGSFVPERGNDRIPYPVLRIKSLQIPVSRRPESGYWKEDWYTTWKSRRDNPNKLVTFTEADIPSLNMNSSGTTSTSTTITESHSYDHQSVQSSDTTASQKKKVLIEIGNLVSVPLHYTTSGGERTSKVHPDYTSSLRRSRWRKKYMRREFAFDAEM